MFETVAFNLGDVAWFREGSATGFSFPAETAVRQGAWRVPVRSERVSAE